MASIFLRRDALLFEIGNEDGLVYAEDVSPGGNATVHIIVFNRRKLPALDEQLRELVKWAFRVFGLGYMSAFIPEFNAGARSLVTRMGWTLDGVLRGFLVYSGQRVDAYAYSISREEVGL